MDRGNVRALLGFHASMGCGRKEKRNSETFLVVVENMKIRL